MDKSKKLETLKELLTSAGYPEIKYKDREFIKTILSKQNRTQLLIWAYTQVNNTDISLDTKSKNILQTFLTVNGFCRPSEVENFITGSNIKLNDEFEIFKRIFCYLIFIRHAKSDDQIYKDLLTPEQLADIVAKKYNVLPAHIIRNELSEGKKHVLYDQLLTENDNLERKINEMESQLYQNENKMGPPEMKDTSVDMNKLLSDVIETNTEYENFISNFEFIKKMYNQDDKLFNLDQLNQQFFVIQESMENVNNLLKMIEVENHLKQLEKNLQKKNFTTTENGVNIENIQILEKTLSSLKDFRI